MAKFRVKVVWIARDWTEVEVEAASPTEAAALVDSMDLSPEHLDSDPEVEINAFELPVT